MAKIKDENQTAVTPPGLPPIRGLTKEGYMFNDQIDARLTKFMADNPEMTEYFTKLVKEHPDRAIRSFAMRTMFKHEKLAERNALQIPQAREWVKENPALAQEVAAKIKTTNPIFRAAAFLRGIGRAKANIDFAPPAAKTGVSIPI
jgi:hypothetical protein